MGSCDFGFIGLGVMGKNLALNVESRGFCVAVNDHINSVTDHFIAENSDKNFYPGNSLAEFVSLLSSPRMIQIMVPAGKIVDDLINELVPLLHKGDLIIDGGNTLYSHTIRRDKYLASKGIRFLGVGISGGEEGALKGPSIMPSGDFESWKMVQPIFEAIAARVDNIPCVMHIGPDGAGHYVKMVHNGIEYADMQIICEAYHILKASGFTNTELSEIFAEWNKGDLESYLIEITSLIFSEKDPDSQEDLVDIIVDRAGQKGTGRWTAMAGVRSAVPLSTIAGSVEARILSSRLDQRTKASGILKGPNNWYMDTDSASRSDLIAKVYRALYASKIIAYAQGLDLLALAGEEQSWNLDLGSLAKIWRGGCIIRAKFLNNITEAYISNPSLKSLMLSPIFATKLNDSQQDWRDIVALAVSAGIPVPSIGGSLSYYDAFRSRRLPANLLQAQRDFFGAHSYERTDAEPGQFFHHDQWPQLLD